MRILLGFIVACALLMSFAVTAPFLQPTDRIHDVEASLRYLRTVDPTPMQQLFPEGEFFTAALTGLTAGHLARQGALPSTVAEQDIRRALDVVNQPQVSARFGLLGDDGPTSLQHGIFCRGWRLLLMVELARVAPATKDAMSAEADVVARVLSGPTLPASYPGGIWPCDLVVAMAAVRRADAVTPREAEGPMAAAWVAKMRRFVDPATGLLPHRITAEGGVLEQPRATSSTLISTFLFDVDQTWASEYYRQVRANFWTTRLVWWESGSTRLGSPGWAMRTRDR